MQRDEYRRMYEAEDTYWWFVSRRRLARRLLQRSGAPAGPLLDLGCGTGAATRFFAEALPDRQVVGADFSPEALRFATERGLPHLVRANAETLPFINEGFGTIVSLDLLEHVADDAAATREVYRCLKPGGVFVVNVPAYRWLWGAHDTALMHYRRYSAREVRALLGGAGFHVERLSHTVFLLFPLVLLQRVMAKLRRSQGVNLPRVPDPLNTALIRLLDFEGWLVERMPLPWGSSLTAVARKPGRD